MTEEHEQQEGQHGDADCWLSPDIGYDVDAAEPETFDAVVGRYTSEMLQVAGAHEIRLIGRRAWGARAAKRPLSRLNSTRGVKIHYTGSFVNPLLVHEHARCAPAVRAIQNSHMDANDWSDIGYNLVVCPHRYVFVGRGEHVLPAANGAGLNSGHYAVLALVGARGLVQPNQPLLEGLTEAIGWLRTVGDAGMEVKCHKDGYATDCPGDPLTKWVRSGAARPVPGKRLLRLETPQMHGRDVVHVQERLNLHYATPRLLLDGFYGPRTARAVRWFQDQHRLLVDGIVGPITLRALDAKP